MKFKTIVGVNALTALLVACGGGDINLNANSTNNSVDNSQVTTTTSGSSNPCASYEEAGATIQGSFDGINCSYDSTFVGVSKPLSVDLRIPFISGVHIFRDSLFVGDDVTPAEIAAGTSVPQQGEGPTLTIDAGSRLAFSNPSDYVRIARGSSIVAQGTANAPIIFSAFSDLVTGTAQANAVSLWGGIMINGNGITNNCTDAERTTGTCAVQSEGQESYYGGDNNTESSGTLSYVIVKHSGFAVVEGDELNGITFNAVGSGTQVNHIQVYNTFDDGLEFFGGAVNVSHAILTNVRDDSLDFSDGYVGNIQYALIQHEATNGNRCIEGDNVSSSRVSDTSDANNWLITPITNPTVSNMTCITSGFDESAGGTHGDSEGILLRRGIQAEIYNSIITSPAGGNECLELDNNGTILNANNGDITMTSVYIACSEAVKGIDVASDGPLNDGGTAFTFDTDTWFDAETETVQDTETATLLNGIFTSTSPTDSSAAAITFVETDVSTLPQSNGFFENPSVIGAVDASDDWTAGWALSQP